MRTPSTYGWILALSSLLAGAAQGRESPYEYKEMNFRLNGGRATVKKNPSNFDDAYRFGAGITYFIFKPVALDTFYRYSTFDEKMQQAGGGPLVRVLDLPFVRAELGGHANYVRVLDGSHFGWGASLQAHYPFRAVSWLPFVGPYVSYDQVLLPGKNLSTLGFGLTFGITGKTDFN